MPTEYVKILNFNSNKVFGISVSACVLIIKLSDADITTNVCEVADFSERVELYQISNVKMVFYQMIMKMLWILRETANLNGGRG